MVHQDKKVTRNVKFYDFTEAGRDAIDARKISGVCLGIFSRHRVTPKERLYVPTESSFPTPSKYVDVARQTKINSGNLEESRMDDCRNTGGHRIFSLKVGSDPRDSASRTNVHTKDVHGWMVG